MHDYQLAYGDRVRHASVPTVTAGTWGEPTLEVDSSLGFYTHANYDWKSGSVGGFYFDNSADDNIVKRDHYGWDTRFCNLSVSQRIFHFIDLHGQFLWGNSKMASINNVVDNDYWAYYILPSLDLVQHRFTLRCDNYKVEDKDSFNDPNESWG